MVTHSGEKLNKCKDCNYTCSDPSALRSHVKKHGGEKFPPAWAAPYAPWSWWGERGDPGGAASTKAERHGGLLTFAHISLLTIFKMIQGEIIQEEVSIVHNNQSLLFPD